MVNVSTPPFCEFALDVLEAFCLVFWKIALFGRYLLEFFKALATGTVLKRPQLVLCVVMGIQRDGSLHEQERSSASQRTAMMFPKSRDLFVYLSAKHAEVRSSTL